MTLLQIRTWFVQESGRYDLVVDTSAYLDNGADKYLKAGQRMLDRMQQTRFSTGRNFQLLTANSYYLQLHDCRSVLEVWQTVPASDDGRVKLEKKSISELRALYPNMDTIEAGTPLYYSPTILRAAPEADLVSRTPTDPFAAVANYLDVLYDATHSTVTGVMIMPPVDVTTLIETWGYFYTYWPAADDKTSFWMENHPELVIMAGQCVLEKFQRNTEGVKDWTAAIRSELDGLDFDLVDEETAEISQMGG
jgi:hypothetical protein